MIQHLTALDCSPPWIHLCKSLFGITTFQKYCQTVILFCSIIFLFSLHFFTNSNKVCSFGLFCQFLQKNEKSCNLQYAIHFFYLDIGIKFLEFLKACHVKIFLKRSRVSKKFFRKGGGVGEAKC